MKLIRFAFGFATGTLISRVLGFVRDAVIAYQFGASHVSDAFFIAFRIPNSFRRLLGEGGFNAVFVPLYTKALEEGRGKDFISKVFTFYLLANITITLLGVLFSEYIVSLIAPGVRDKETFELAVFMARFLFLYLILVGVNSLFMGTLNVKGKFFIPALSQAVFNGVFSLVLLLLTDAYGHTALILGVLLGGICQVLLNVPFLSRSRVKLGMSLNFDKEVRLLLRRLVPALGGFGVNQLSLFIDTFLASFLRTGAISYLYYANRLYQLPFGIISVGIANSLLSLLSKKDTNRSEEITNAFRVLIILTIPASAGLILLSEEIVSVVYQRGVFSAQDVHVSAGALSLYSLGLLPFSLQKSLSALFFSQGDTLTPVKASLYTVVFEGLCAFMLAFPLGFGIMGLPAGTTLSSMVGLSYLLSKSTLKPDLRDILSTLWKALVCTSLMGLVVLYVRVSFDSELTRVLLSIPLAIAVYFSALVLLRESLTLRLLKGFVK